MKKVIREVEEFDHTKLTKRWSGDQKAIETAIDGALASVFGSDTAEYRRYSGAGRLDQGDVEMGSSWVDGPTPQQQAQAARENVAEGKRTSIQLLNQAIRWLEDEIGDSASESTPTANVGGPVFDRRVFIVHGHDELALQSVARFVEGIGFEAVVLKEQANQGQTIIEKIERHGNVGFAIVLLTPDDVGCKVGGTPTPRARQNVLMELGYFMGRLGRSRICALTTSSGMELPTDFAGVLWQALDEAGAWKQSLARELQASGFEINWNEVMK